MKDFAEKVYLENLECVEQACHNLGLQYRRFGNLGQIVEVNNPRTGRTLRFWRNKNPFNHSMSTEICSDKVLQLDYFEEFNLPHPRSTIIYNPYSQTDIKNYAKYKNFKEIEEVLIEEYGFPFILKKHRSSLARHVYLIQKRQHLSLVLEHYLAPERKAVLLAQEYIQGREFRVIAYRGNVLLAYEKVSQKEQQSSKSANKDLNPLHSGKAIKVNDHSLLEIFSNLSAKVFDKLHIDFCGMDIILNKQNEPFILETNSDPACYFYNSGNGRDDFTRIYQQCLTEYLR